jgi:hypothetical protein
LKKANNAMGSIENILKLTESLNLPAETSLLQSWQEKLAKLLAILKSSIYSYTKELPKAEEIKKLFFPENGLEVFSIIHEKAEAKYPVTSPEQNSWDTLTRLEENLKALEEANETFEKAQGFSNCAKLLLEKFIESRDAVLKSLYDDIKDRFVELYRLLHGVDENSFSANIQPSDAGLSFEVDFYGRGTNPPHALHSEGHQDSMGICLWLALSEHLTKGIIDLAILDDVVMSVDADHRRFTCELLTKHFPDRQFLLTTHDKTWVNQLKYSGFVDSTNIVEFYNWHIDTGPLVNFEPYIWNKIEEDLMKNDVPIAAARLRRGSESFFRSVCSALMAPIIFREDYRWELGHFLFAAMDRYRNIIKLAKNAAQSWGNEEVLGNLVELDSVRKQIFSRTHAEQWAVNTSVHYNNWANLEINDFKPVVEAFQDLFGLFSCSNCGGMLHLSLSGNSPSNLRCKCGNVNWNLIKKT